MNTDELITKLFFLLDQLCHKIVIKDFVGFMNWDNTLGTALLPYTGHHASVCAAVKQNARAYAKCVRCSHVHQYDCTKFKEAFVIPCFLGLSEYSVPILIGDQCIGSISAGLWCTDPDASEEKIRALAAQFDMDCELLLHLFSELPTEPAFSLPNRSVVDFIAVLLAELFRPFVHHTQSASSKKQDIDKGFHTILTYIRNNYTDPGISVTSIAKACNYSRSYVSHTFSRYMKMNLRTYINQMRVILAKHELQSGSSVALTAMVCGFSDANYFTTIFRQVVGVSASQYARNTNRRERYPLQSDSRKTGVLPEASDRSGKG